VIPDFGYLKDKKDWVRAIVITHGHEDHIGAIQHVMREFPDAPLYATPLTRGLLEVKLKEARLLDKTKLITVPVGGAFEVGPFKVETFRMCHSIPDNVGLAIETPAGLIVHSGDFKFDHTPVDGKPSNFGKLAEYGNRGVLALFSDSTNAEVPGHTASEREIEPEFEHIFRDAEGRIIVATFASLISRVQQVVNVCRLYERRLALAGTSMQENVKMAQKMGYLDIPDGMLVKCSAAWRSASIRSSTSRPATRSCSPLTRFRATRSTFTASSTGCFRRAPRSSTTRSHACTSRATPARKSRNCC